MRFAFTSMRTQNSAASGTRTSPSFVSIASRRRAARKFDVAHGTKRRRSARFPHFATDQVADKVISGVEPRALLDRHLNFQSAQALRVLNTGNIRKMKNDLAAPAWRKPASLHADEPRRASPVGEPHFAQLR